VKIDVKGVIVPNDDKAVYDYFGMDAVSPREVLALIDKSGNEKIDVHINSPGGDVFAGTEIYEALRAYRGQVAIHVIYAASAAGIIAEAGESDISPTGMFMLHNVSGGASGDYNTLESAKGLLLTANKAISTAYQIKTGKPEKELLAMMNKGSDNMGTWLTAKEAVEQKFIDKISENQNMRLSAAYGSPLLSQQVIEKIRNQLTSPPDEADILMQKTAQAKLNLLKVKVTRK